MDNEREFTLLNIKGKVVKIDNKCVPLVKYFNSIGLDTKYCCEGHNPNEPFTIMFEDYVTDEKIFSFIKQFSNKYDHTPFVGKFVKWARKMGGEIALNWVYIANTQECAEIDYLRMNSEEFKVKKDDKYTE